MTNTALSSTQESALAAGQTPASDVPPIELELLKIPGQFRYLFSPIAVLHLLSEAVSIHLDFQTSSSLIRATTSMA